MSASLALAAVSNTPLDGRDPVAGAEVSRSVRLDCLKELRVPSNVGKGRRLPRSAHHVKLPRVVTDPFQRVLSAFRIPEVHGSLFGQLDGVECRLVAHAPSIHLPFAELDCRPATGGAR